MEFFRNFGAQLAGKMLLKFKFKDTQEEEEVTEADKKVLTDYVNELREKIEFKIGVEDDCNYMEVGNLRITLLFLADLQ